MDSLRIATQPIVDLVDGRIAGYGVLSLCKPSGVDAVLTDPTLPADGFLALKVDALMLGTRELGAVLPNDLYGLVFELSEPVSDDPTLPATIRNYRRRGAQFTLVDRAIADTAVVQPERIKLGRGLVSLIGRSPGLVGALAHAALRTGAEVCAEGVDSLQKLRWLHRAGVTVAQGSLLQTPDLDDLLDQVRTPSLLDVLDTPRPRSRRFAPQRSRPKDPLSFRTVFTGL